MVVLLSGDLGAGKTCLAQGVARGLEVSSKAPVTSPSYSLLNIYSGRLPLYHFDLYRLNRIEDLGDLGFDEYAEGEGVTLVEWADRVSDRLDASLAIDICRHDETVRQLKLEALDETGEKLVELVRAAWSERHSNPPEKP